MPGTRAHSASFVRRDPLPELPPPTGETGVLRWLRVNLFSSVGNTVLTLVALYAIVWFVMQLTPWIANGVWDANSLSECRTKLAGDRGGCFAVIAERWPQLIFGNYPADQRPRAVLAFVMLFVALAPVLFIDLPRRLLWFTGLFPFIAYWLIWGGTLWLPIMALLGVIGGYLVYRALEPRSFFGAIVAGLFVTITFWLTLADPVATALAKLVPLWLAPVQSRAIGGFMINFILGTSCIALSLPLGIALALGRTSDLPVIRMICILFIEFIRGVPLITLLFVASVMLAYFLPPGTNFDLILRVIIMITLFAAAYIAEAVRGGLAALPKGQFEAGASLGLDYWSQMRLIILPQALKISIPSIVNIAIGLFKDTTLVSIISMFDMVGMIRGPILSSTEWFGVYWELFGFAAILFFIFCYGISQYSQYLERRLATDHR
jgi:general L-amino acid transport system permease protein